MSRSTFSILPYINRQKVKADGTANILCRITVDGKSAAISTGISCTPQEWNAKKGEVRNARDSGRLASFLAEVKDKYNSLLTTNGIITVEMLKAVLKDKDTTGRFLLNFGDTIVEWYRTAKARQTFLHKRTWQKNLRAFVHSLDKDDIAFEDIDENFGEEYKLFLKRDQGRIDSYVNHCLLWLNMLMYKAVDRSIIRFNPIAKIGYEKKAAPKMTHISKADFIKMLSTPMADERTELARRCFIFASLTSLSYIDVKKLYPHHISENSEGRKFIRKEREKTGVEFFVPLHPIAEKILSLYNTTDDSKPVFPLGEKKDIYLDVHTLGMVLGISNKLGFHASRHTFGVLMLNEDIPIGSIAKMMGHADITSTQVYAQVTEQKISNDMDKLIAKREKEQIIERKNYWKMNRGVITISESGTVSMPTDTVWMTMQEIADMYNVFGCYVRKAVKAIFKDGILKEQGVRRHVRKNDRISYDVYSLELVIAVAFRIDSIESRAFREFIMQAIIKKQTNRPKLVCLWSKNIMV